MAEDEKRELIARLEKARAQMGSAASGLRHELDFKAKARRSFRTHTPAWIIGAVVGGLVLSQLRRRPKPAIEVKRSAIKKEDATKAAAVIALGKLALDLLRPTLIAWARSKLLAGFSARAQKAQNF